MRGKPARVAEEDSETPYMTRRAMDFIAEAGERALVPAPLLHQAALALHRAGALQRHVRPRRRAARRALARRSGATRIPIFAEFMDRRVSKAFARDEVREEVIPVYMGLIKQIDDQLGRLFRFMQERGLLDNTMIVFTSDHGDYLGDHWMGEKDLFHEPSVKVPLIVCDPSPEADGARGTVCDELVEAIDLAPTFLEALGADPARAVAPARGPLARALPARQRARRNGAATPSASTTIRSCRWRPSSASSRATRACSWSPTSAGSMIHAVGFRPMLYDLESDPNEFRDLGADPAFAGERRRLMAVLAAWGLRLSQRTTLSGAADPRPRAASRSAAAS